MPRAVFCELFVINKWLLNLLFGQCAKLDSYKRDDIIKTWAKDLAALNLRRGNIGIIMVIVIAWLFQILFYMAEEFEITSSVGSFISLSYLALLAGVAIYCKYLLLIAVVFFIGNLYAASNFYKAMMVPYGGEAYLYARKYSSMEKNISIFDYHWDSVVQHYIFYFQDMQEPY